ncbi:isoform b [Lasius niger]|uniref:Isoform b n=1 Tax=Lasius niger TaxID=67767 RepID=A0A0J7KYE1_LASNI|nr:isoform b [Lasius niger]
MENIMRSIQGCNAIRYTSYRTAAKMQILHKELNMQHVQLELIAGVFERHRLSITENCVNLDSSEIEDVLSDIYFAAQKESNFNFDVDFVTKLATNYILNTFDKQSTGNILVFSVKVALVLLSNVVHNIRCSSCKVTPIQGPRYTCLKCTGYHQCQECFLLGKTSNKHKLKHPIREFCVKISHREVTKLIIELIINKLRLCPTRTIPIEDPVADATSNETRRMDYGSVRSTIKRKILSDPQKELQSIIMHLEEENRQLQIELLDIQGTKAERLQRHRATIESQLQRLKTLKKYLFTDMTQVPQIITRMQSTPMLPPLSSRLTALPLEFELSPIIRQDATDQQKTLHRKNKLTSDFNTSSTIEHTGEKNNANALSCAQEASTSSGFGNIPENSRMELSTWIGGRRRELSTADSGFSQWLAAGNSNCKDNYATNAAISNTNNDSSLIASQSPTGIHRDNTPSSLQRPDKHSQHSSLQNIQGDLNDILDRLQNMVANDCLLDESYDGNDNCKLKRATTEMEDLLTGLIEGMESRKSKLTTIV